MNEHTDSYHDELEMMDLTDVTERVQSIISPTTKQVIES